jgi:hypothetical protein
MARRLLPLLAVVPLGVVVGLLSAAGEWSHATRLLVTAALVVPIVAIGTPFALLRLAWTPPPEVGRARFAAHELRGIYAEYPFTPRTLPAGLATGPRSTDLSALLPLVGPDVEARGEAVKRVILVAPPDKRTYYSQLESVPHDLVLWPERRRRSLRRAAKRALRRSKEGRRDRSEAPPDRPDDRVIDTAVL